MNAGIGIPPRSIPIEGKTLSRRTLAAPHPHATEMNSNNIYFIFVKFTTFNLTVTNYFPSFLLLHVSRRHLNYYS